MEIITCNNNEIKINSYVIKQNNHALVIDPNNFEEIENTLENCKLDYILLTHEHFDHIMAVDKLRDTYNCKVIAHSKTSENIQSTSKNLSRFSSIILDFMKIIPKRSIKEFTIKKADIIFEKGYTFTWQNLEFILIHTPGHSSGSSCILVNDILFSGDSLFESYDSDIKGPGTSRKDYFNITIPFFKSLKSSTKVYPGHYNQFVLGNKSISKKRKQ